MRVSKFAVLGGFVIWAMSLIVGLCCAVAQSPPPPSAGAAAAPATLATISAGPLEITPKSAHLVLGKNFNDTCLYPTFRFQLKNASAADIKVILYQNSIDAIDNLGQPLFYNPYIESGGMTLSKMRKDNFSHAFEEEKGSFVSLSPKQVFEVQLRQDLNNTTVQIQDKDNDFLRNHRPATATFSAAIGVISMDNQADIRAFSFSDIPLQVLTR